MALFVQYFIKEDTVSFCLFYRPQTKFAKVMFLHVSVILSTGWGGHAWWGGACMARGVCMVGGMHGRGHAWQGACVAGGACLPRTPPGRYYGYGIRSMSGRYASYCNAFLFKEQFLFYGKKWWKVSTMCIINIAGWSRPPWNNIASRRIH